MERQYVEGRVSVITPVYNVEKYIDKTLESVFNQTYKDIEIVMVDDCSEDNSAEIISDFQKTHPEIIYFQQPHNMGAGAARNKCLEFASGQYVAFLDSDDLWYPEKLEKQINCMKEKKSPFSYAAIEMINEEGVIIKGKRNLKENCDYKYLLRNTVIATSSVVIDRMELGEFRMPLRRGGQDYATWLGLLRGGVIAQGINEPLVRYRVRGNSLSSNKFSSLKQVWDIQTNVEHINKISGGINVLYFCINALKKYLL